MHKAIELAMGQPKVYLEPDVEGSRNAPQRWQRNAVQVSALHQR
jgi:hypothetical protein